MGIDTVCIEDPYEAFETTHFIISEERKQYYVSEVQKILENHIYHGKNSLNKMTDLANEIVREITEEEQPKVIDIEERNGSLYEHTVLVTMLSLVVAKMLKVKEESYIDIAIGALLHDLGMRYITVPYINFDMDNRPASEVFELKKHTILAYSALEGEDWISPVSKKMVLSHHERKDGSGYPLKQKTKDIECNILQVCDTFDCMISGMECKRISVQQALETMIEAADLLFERKIVKVLQKIVAYYPVGTKIRLNTGETGIVVCQTDNSIRPVVAVLDQDNQMTEIRYDLAKNKKISILQLV